jgi:ribosome-binding ATPase YchF (GTP1/OBG family)
MKTGIIGLPQVGKTSLFRILTKAQLDAHAMHSRDAHLGIAKVPDERLDKLSALFHPKKTTHATVEYVDVAAIGQEALKESAYAQRLREVDSLTHVLRAFEDPAIPHVGEINPLKDARDVEADLVISDLVQIEKRMEGLAKDLKKIKSDDLVREHELLLKCKEQLESGRPLLELELNADDKKRLRGFAFLSQKPILYVVNIGESAELGKDLDAAAARYDLAEIASRPNSGATAICGKVEAERADTPHSQDIRASGANLILHRRRGRMPRLDRASRRSHAAGGGCDPLGSREALHPRRDDPLGPASRRRLRSQRPLQGHAAAGGQGVHRPGRRRDEHPAQRVEHSPW